MVPCAALRLVEEVARIAEMRHSEKSPDEIFGLFEKPWIIIV